MSDELRNLPVDLIQKGRYQPRYEFNQEKLEELAESISSQGVVQPIVVRPIGSNRYEIIAGERRWRATQIAGLHDIPAVVRDVPDAVALQMALIENIQREDMSPMEEAEALGRLRDEFGLSHNDIAADIGKSRSEVTNKLRLLTLDQDTKLKIHKGLLSEGHGKVLVGVDEGIRPMLVREILNKGLSVRVTEERARVWNGDKPARGGQGRAEKDTNVKALEQAIGQQLGCATEIQYKNDGSGKVLLKFYSLEELEGILERMQKNDHPYEKEKF